MKQFFQVLLLTSLVASTSFSLPTGEKPSGASSTRTMRIPKVEIKKSADVTTDAQPGEKPAINATLVAILNQIVGVYVTADFRYSSRGEKNTGFSYLRVKAAAKFDGDIKIELADEAKTNPQVRNVIPSVQLKTKDMLVVFNLDIKENGQFRVRFCQSYTVGNDICNTFDGKKLLDISLASKTFRMQEIRIEEFSGTFDTKEIDGKLGFKGVCSVYKPIFDPKTVANPIFKKVDDCSFSGDYKKGRTQPFEYDFNFVSTPQ